MIYIGLLLIALAIAIIIKTIKDKKELDKKDNITPKIDIIKSELRRYDGYSRMLSKNNVLVFITEYYIYIAAIIDELGMICGSENDDLFVVKFGQTEKSLKNDIPYINDLVNKITNELGQLPINKYLVMGSSSMVTFNVKDVKLLRTDDVYYTFIKKDGVKNYTPEQIDNIASVIQKSMM